MTSNLSLGATFTHVFFWHWADIKPFLKTFNPWNKEPLVIHDAVGLAFAAMVTRVSRLVYVAL